MASEEPIMLQTEYGTYPVFVTDGIGDERFRLTIRCKTLESDFYTFVSEAAAEILSTAVCDGNVESEAFKRWLVDQIKVVNAAEFYLGKTRFIQQSTRPQPPAQSSSSAVMGELSNVIRTIGDHKTMHERQVWSTSTLYDSLAKGFHTMQTIATSCSEQDQSVHQLASDLAQLTAQNKALKAELLDSISGCDARHDRAETTTEAELARMNTRLSHENKNLRQDLRVLALKLQELQAHQAEQIDLWKQLHCQAKTEMQQLKRTTEALRKDLDQVVLDKAAQAIQIKDALRLLNESQARTSRQMNTMRGEMQYLRDMKGQQDTNTQSLGDLKDMYMNLLPKLQQAYMSERRREASEAVSNLNLTRPASPIAAANKVRNR